MKLYGPKILVTSLTLCLVLTTVLPLQAAVRKRRTDCSKQLSRAITHFNKGHYNQSKTTLTEIKYQCGGFRGMDSLLYYLAMSNIRLKAPVEARGDLERLIQDFPLSSFTDQAHYLIGYSSYLESHPPQRDQEKTFLAMRELADFIDRFPESPFADSARHYYDLCTDKLAQKAFQSASFYQKIEQHEAAVLYFKDLIKRYPQTTYALQSRLLLAENLIRVSQPVEAGTVLDELLQSEIPPDIQRKANELRIRLTRRQADGSPAKRTPWFPPVKSRARTAPDTLSNDQTTEPPAQETDPAPSASPAPGAPEAPGPEETPSDTLPDAAPAP